MLTFFMDGSIMYWIGIDINLELDQLVKSKGKVIVCVIRESFPFQYKVDNSYSFGFIEEAIVIGIKHISSLS